MSLLGFQFWPNASGANEAAAFVRDMKPAVVKVLEPHTNDPLSLALRDLSPNTLVVFRFVAFFNDRQWVLGRSPSEAAAEARNHYAELRNYLLPRKGKFDLVELFNEPGSVGAELDALVAYTNAFAEKAAEDGIRVASYCFATGTPREASFSKLKALDPRLVVFGPHEYAWENSPQWGWHFLRFEKWVPSGGLVFIGETGQEPGGIARWGEGAFRDLMVQYDTALVSRANVLGAAIFNWNGQSFGWGDFAIWPSQEAWLREYLRTHPPIYRRSLLYGPPPPEYRPGDLVQVQNYLNLRSTPVFAHNIIRVLSPGEILGVYEFRAPWLRVVAVKDGAEGWCYSTYVRLWRRLVG